MTNSSDVSIGSGVGTPPQTAALLRSAKASARAAGILYLISWVCFFVGAALVSPMRDVGHDLAAIHTQSGQLITGVLLEFGDVAATVGFAVVLLPYLRSGGEALAHGYVAMRVLGAVMYLIAGAATASLITLSEQFVAAGSPVGGAYRAAQAVAVGQATWAVTLDVAPFAVGAVLLYVLLYRTRLVPRFIAVWGLVGVGMLAVANLINPDVTQLGAGALLVVPMSLNELFLAGWLIVKGFDRRALAPTDAPPPAADSRVGAAT
jgi:hypothetical protein